MSKILFFARDPGGANCIIPIIKGIKSERGCIVEVLAKDRALDRIKSAGITSEHIDSKCDSNNISSISEFLGKKAYDVVVTATSVDDFAERFIWSCCKERGIPSIAIVDQWTNLGIRFSRFNYSQEDEYRRVGTHDYVPDYICVMDELARKMIIREGISEKLVVVTGQPHFDSVKLKFSQVNGEREESRKTITFVSEPIFRDYDNYGKENYWGFNEFSIFEELIESIRNSLMSRDLLLNVIVRPHPRDDLEKWVQTVGLVDDLNISIDNISTTYELLKKSSLVCGMSSMMLLEAAICDVPIMSIMIGLKRDNPFMLNNIGICDTIISRDQLQSQVNDFFDGKHSQSNRFDYIENATENVIQLVKEVIKNGKSSY